MCEKDLHMNVNEYTVEMVPKDRDAPLTIEVVESATPMTAAKGLELSYPDLKVVRITREWIPIDSCQRCGAPIFKGDYHNDQIYRRNGKKYCLDCKARQ